MTKRARRTHSPSFKAKVALAAIKGEKTLASRLKARGCHHLPRPVFAVTRHTRGIRKQFQGLTAGGFWACVYAVAGVSAASVTASSCFGIGIPSFFSRSASSPTIFVR
jgi:hypothetical protein